MDESMVMLLRVIIFSNPWRCFWFVGLVYLRAFCYLQLPGYVLVDWIVVQCEKPFTTYVVIFIFLVCVLLIGKT